MAAKSQDPKSERFGDAKAAAIELPGANNPADMETLFLAELRSRRERLARWMQLIQEEVTRESAPRARARRWHHCRTRVAAASAR
jgi:hypothetical protein